MPPKLLLESTGRGLKGQVAAVRAATESIVDLVAHAAVLDQKGLTGNLADLKYRYGNNFNKNIDLRGGNFAIQKSDLIIALGTRLSQMITGGKQDLFAPHAKKIMIDVDKEEIEKFDKNTFELDLSINSTLTEFFDKIDHINASKFKSREPILCSIRKSYFREFKF